MNTQPLAIVTGGALSGIGEAITRRLVSDGYSVVGSFEPSDRSQADTLLKSLDPRSSISLHETDHADRRSLDALIEKLPANQEVTALVNAQFYFAMEDPIAFDFATWDRSLAESDRAE